MINMYHDVFAHSLIVENTFLKISCQTGSFSFVYRSDDFESETVHLFCL